MIKLTTSTDAQTIKVIPRSYATSVSMVFRDDSTNTSVTYSTSATTGLVAMCLRPSLIC